MGTVKRTSGGGGSMRTVRSAPGQPAADGAAAGSTRAFARSFPATTAQVRDARQFLAQALGDCPLAGDALTCLSELAANSVLHSNSRRPGGCFTVRARLGPAGLRVEVEDEGGPWRRRPGQDDACGRGLMIVGALASAWSITGNGTRRTVWFELSPRPPASAGVAGARSGR
jgi:anti-sigma regulatory factor (Ser/Thr protein kinase)